MSEHSQQIEDVARVIRARIGGEASPAEDAAGPARLAARIGRASAPRRQFNLGMAVAFAAVCLVFGYASSTKLGYVVSAPSLSAGATGASSESSVAFSDGSRIRLAAGAVGQVESTSFRGAVFRLEDGTLEADVVHRRLTHWSVKAGPFTVEVKGTRFAVSWSPVARRFVLTLHDGAVEVRGDLLREARKVQTGERLVVDLVAQRAWLENGVAPEAKPDAAVPVAPGAASEVPTVETPAIVAVPSARAALVEHEHGQASKSAPEPSWAERVAAGDFRGVVDDAQHRGTDSVLTQAPSSDLSALADAARYVGDRALSTRALNAQRQRFPDTERAAMAAFLLGKLAEESGNVAGAAELYARYLSERPSGTFAQEALGRRMLTLRNADPKAATQAAREYLQRFPQGPRAGAARQITGPP